MDGLGKEKLNEMIGVLEREGSHLTLTPSKVAGAILVNFCDKYFEREKKRLEADLFDKKSYLAWANKKAKTPDEFIELVSKIDDLAPKSQKRKPSKPRITAQNASSEGSLE
ncbi:MAG: hypothetical protein KDD34_10150 [Bdellovibrionales bacterium]|nr:hypothetical protein [Bdellovibrionales bacterium]